MATAPRVSVVIPAFENAPYIRATVASVLAQTYPDFELVVADHSSTDGTWEILQEFASDPRVRLLRTPAGGGAVRNWNRVTEAARGELVKLVCGDDLLAPEALATQVAAFDAHDAGGDNTHEARWRWSPRPATSSTRPDGWSSAGTASVACPGGCRGARPFVARSLRGANIFGEPCCVLLRRSALEAVGGWHGEPGYLIDQSTYCRVLLHGDLATAPGTLAAFRLSSTQWSVALAREQARSAAEMHRQVAELAPGLLSSRDLRVGNARARLRAFQRRLVYLYLGRRMQPPAQMS